MKVFIISDLEGIVGVDRIEMRERGTELYKLACAELMRDVNTAARACFDSGAEEVFVLDGHGGGGNFRPGELDSRARQLTVAQMCEYARLGKFDYCLEIGAHAMAGTVGGFLDHTQNSAKWFEYSVNGIPLGEVEKHAIFFASCGIRTLLVSGDEAVCREVSRFIPGIRTVAVKDAKIRNRAEVYDSEQCRARIYDTVRDALSAPDKVGFIDIKPPLTVRLTLCRTDFCEEILAKSKPEDGIRRINARCIEKDIAKIENYAQLGF